MDARTPEALQSTLIARMPEIFGSLRIDDYTVLAAGDGASPVAWAFAEVMTLLGQFGIRFPQGGKKAPPEGN
ncbi:MAG: hypothetical protein NT080_08785 [Spirochaetes bacterium]|nr:hypothetical protein [Spirochaetota bacterium]